MEHAYVGNRRLLIMQTKLKHSLPARLSVRRVRTPPVGYFFSFHNLSRVDPNPITQCIVQLPRLDKKILYRAIVISSSSRIVLQLLCSFLFVVSSQDYTNWSMDQLVTHDLEPRLRVLTPWMFLCVIVDCIVLSLVL